MRETCGENNVMCEDDARIVQGNDACTRTGTDKILLVVRGQRKENARFVYNDCACLPSSHAFPFNREQYFLAVTLQIIS